ncbi:hypothetical protein BUALT_Bualt03G0072800 [Buddleja alternifolia]|uniref:Cysteine-rich PDZ-binding protein n=1 Tax=Buddleja alternifolia TaxID=168488 RepID=A0AAV6XSZ9_9LAMI|nr:hypothetical protein BUALT_Bualt03G0072800 [Buddleja alternifolia]
MVCEKCEKKLAKIIVPDKWKEGASNTTEGGGRKINENKLLSKKNRCDVSIVVYVLSVESELKFMEWNVPISCAEELWFVCRDEICLWTPYGQTKCIICKQQVHQNGKYCHTCAYSKGVCAMCGKQVIDTKFYKQSNTLCGFYNTDNWDCHDPRRVNISLGQIPAKAFLGHMLMYTLKSIIAVKLQRFLALKGHLSPSRMMAWVIAWETCDHNPRNFSFNAGYYMKITVL